MFGEMPRYFDNTEHFENLKDEFYEKNPVANTFFIGDRLFSFGGNTLFELPQESVKKYFDMDLNVQSKSAYEMFAKGIENFTPKNEFYKENELSKPQTADLQKIKNAMETEESLYSSLDQDNWDEILDRLWYAKFENQQEAKNFISSFTTIADLRQNNKNNKVELFKTFIGYHQILKEKIKKVKEFDNLSENSINLHSNTYTENKVSTPNKEPQADISVETEQNVARDVEIPIETSLDTQQQKVVSSPTSSQRSRSTSTAKHAVISREQSSPSNPQRYTKQNTRATMGNSNARF